MITDKQRLTFMRHYVRGYGLTKDKAEQLTSEKALADYFELTVYWALFREIENKEGGRWEKALQDLEAWESGLFHLSRKQES